MKKLIFLIVCSILSTILARPSQFPDKCGEENPLTPQDERDLINFFDNTKIYALVLCRAKADNVYNEKTGFNVDQILSMFYGPNKVDCHKPIVQNCVDKYKEVHAHGEKVFKMFKCMIEMEEEKKENC